MMPITTTTEEELALAKLNNKPWRMNHLYKIQTKDSRLMKYKRNLAQLDFATQRTSRDIILKARQMGFTTECCLDLLDETLMHENTSSAIIAHQRESVTVIFEIVRRAFKNYPEELKPAVSFDNRNEIYFPELDSKIFVTLDARGKTIHNLHVSELAFLEQAESMMASVLETVPATGRITFESTANGVGGYFHNVWEDKHTEFKKHFYNWMWDDQYAIETEIPLEVLMQEYQEHVVRYGLIPDIYQRFQLTKEQFYFYITKIRRQKQLVVQEYPTTALEAFISSGRNVFHMSDLQKHVTRFPTDRKWDMLIWEQPMINFRYVIGCDVAEGLGGDYSAIEVFNADTGEQAAEYVSNAVAPDRLAHYLYEIGKMYNNAFINIEVNNHGRSTIDALKKRYYNLYRREVFDKVTNQKTEAIGWRTTGTTKPLLVDNLEEAVRDQSLSIRSERTIKEMKAFVQTDESGKNGFGGQGTNDDCVIACGLALQAIKNLSKQKKPETIAQKKLKEYLKKHSLPTYFNNEPGRYNQTHQELRSRRLTNFNTQNYGRY